MLSPVPDIFQSDDLAAIVDSLTDESHSLVQVQDSVLNEVMEGIFEDVMFGFILEVHRLTKFGVFDLEDTDEESVKQFEIVDAPGLDIFGVSLDQKKKPLECICPSCERNMAASRFAPHLEKCMGMGRCSSRVASRRIATNIHKQDGSDNDSLGDQDNDNDWTGYKRTKKVKREKHNNSPKGRGRPRIRTEALSGLTDTTFQEKLDSQVDKTYLDTITLLEDINQSPTSKSMRYDDKYSRGYLLVDHPSSKTDTLPTLLDDDIHIDIDTCDDLDSQALRDALWEKELTPAGSPADSTGTTNSSGSRKRTKRKGRRKD